MTNEVIKAKNLLERENLQTFIKKMTTVFQSFPPLGVVLVSLLGIGLADKTGLLGSFLKIVVTKVNKSFIYIAIVTMGIVFSGIGDAGFVIMPPLTAILFISIGKSPIVGILLAYASAAVGFTSGLFVSLNDILLSSFTIPAARIIDPNFNASPAMTLYFNLANAILQIIVLTWVTKKIIEPRFSNEIQSDSNEKNQELTSQEVKGLKFAGLSVLIYFIILFLLSLGNNAFLRDENGSLVSLNSTFMGGLIILMSFAFFLAGLVYGLVVGTVKKDKDVVRMISSSLGDMGGYILIVFVSAQFIYLFSESNLGVIMAIKGADNLKNIGFTGFPLILVYILLVAFINIFIGSASAKWAILSPVFIPMFLLLGYDAALTQQAYRIGDSATNMISPLFPYMPLILSFAAKYKKDIGLGTIIANMLPYSIISLIASTLLLIVFTLLNLPFGI